jgi:hypothetical protein
MEIRLASEEFRIVPWYIRKWLYASQCAQDVCRLAKNGKRLGNSQGISEISGKVEN